VSHALAAGDVERVAHLVEGKTFAIVEQEELASLIRQLDALPDEEVRSHPWLCVACAWVLSYAGHVDRLEPLLQVAEAGLDQVDDRTEARSILGHIIHLRSYIADLEGDSSRSSMLGRGALEHIPKDDLTLRAYVLSGVGVSLRKLGDLSGAALAFTEAVALSQAAGDSHVCVMVLCRMATLQIWQGQLNRAVLTCQKALSLAREFARREGRPLPTAGYAHIQMSRVLSERNDLEAAHWHARRGIELAQRWGQADILEFGYFHLAKNLYRQQALESLREVTREINQIISTLPTWFAPDVTEVEVLYRLASGDAKGAFQLAQEQRLGTFESLSPDRYYVFFTFVRLLTIQGKDDPSRLDEALKLLARLLSTAEGTGATGYVIESLVLEAMALQAKGERDQALIALERALSLGEPECYVRTFVDEGAPMGELLREAAGQGIAPQYASRLLSALATPSPHPHPPTLIEPLSERELEVLRLLASSLPTAEIANELFITVSTLRTHTKNIYGKLDVHSRREAVARAQELRLF
jgi:LuxR family maltose regulon positive regulatory protein